VLNHVWRPNFERVVNQFTPVGIAPYRKSTNKQGWLADRDYDEEKPPNTYRIIYLGDSFTEGTCDAADTVPERVEQNLRLPFINQLEVINTGTSSYSPTLYYLLLKKRLLTFNPDLIVINVDMTDVFDDSLYRETLESDQNGDPVACHPGHPALDTHSRTVKGLEELTWAQRFVLSVAKRSKFFELLFAKIMQTQGQNSLKSGEIPPLFAWCAFTQDPKTDGDVTWSMSMLRRSIRLAKSRGIKVVLTGVPHVEQFQGVWSLRPMEELELLSKEENIPFLNPMVDMKQRLGNDLPASLYIPGDMHFNSKGYQVWAETQIAFLARVLDAPAKQSDRLGEKK
jgi:lysophospholipase L1-like esterase